MIEVRDECVGCPPEMGCLGNSCPYMNVEYRVCDTCSSDAEYKINGEDYSYDHAKGYIESIFHSLSLKEKSEAAIGEYTELEDDPAFSTMCDACGKSKALLDVNTDWLCESCAEKELTKIFEEYSLDEQAEYLGIEMESIE